MQDVRKGIWLAAHVDGAGLMRYHQGAMARRSHPRMHGRLAPHRNM